jgi:hypothetical protein
MEQITLPDVITVLVGLTVFALSVCVGTWAWANRVELANRYLSFDTLRRHGIPILSSYWSVEEAPENEQNSEFLADETNSETAETPHMDAETRNEIITFGENQALARLVASGKLGLTEAVKIGADAKSGERYQKRSKQIKELVTQIQDKYPNRTPEQEARRRELELTK